MSLDRVDAGRDPATVHKAANVLLAWDDEKLAMLGGPDERPANALLGSDDAVAARIAAYVEAGADRVIFSYVPDWGIEGLERVRAVLP